MKFYQKGITLIELMVVVAVIGIIAAVSIPSYRSYVSYSEINACARYILPSRLIATNLIISNNSSIAGIDAASLGLSNGSECPDANISVAVAGEVLTISGAAGGKVFRMQRSDAASGGQWSCGIVGDTSTSCSDL